MHLLLLGVSHRTAPVDVRERLDFATRGLSDALLALATRPSASETVVLSTCNRAELYVACEDVSTARQELIGFLGEYHGLDPAALDPHLYEQTDAAAATHLFRVAAGLDSLVVGEPQILGQVKEAYSVAAEQRTVGPVMNKLFPWSFTVGKRVRTETGLSEGAVSVSFAATSLARKIFGDLKGRTVLVIGAGEMGKLTAQHLKGQGVERMFITSRTFAHATALAESIGGTPLPWQDLSTSLAHADIVITATGSTLPILARPQVEGVMRTRRNRPLFMIDIALPRDVDPAVGDLEAVFLYNIDDLQAIVQENLTRRAAEVTRAEDIVGDEVKKFEAWLSTRGAIPTLVALRQRFDAIRRAELERLQPKLAGLPPDARGRVEEVTRLIVEKLLITPTEQLKSIPDPERVRTYADALTRLFALDAEEPARGEPGRGPAAHRAADAGKSVTP
ncbi:MAG TPA: glutamyl-tRNA reductase [Vicinamibacterales bacterium]|jgi:glutamyl-tRNA reductase